MPNPPQHDDEQTIRQLILDWRDASRQGDAARLLDMMDEDVVFLVAGQAPMRGRHAFLAAFKAGLPLYRIDSSAEVQEIQVMGDMAYCWSQLSVTLTTVVDQAVFRRSGPTLTLLRKCADGRWVVFRDANLLTAEAT